MQFSDFAQLSQAGIVRLMREQGPKVVVFPINGTRRWYLLENPPGPETDLLEAYLQSMEKRHIELYKLMFDHGVDYLLTPAFGPDLMARGEEYTGMVAAGLTRLTNDEKFINFYEEYSVRVRFYGDYRRYFENTPYTYLAGLFEELAERTSHNTGPRLFLGLFAHDATETIAELAVHYHQKHGKMPTKNDLIRLYYGEPVPPVSFFLGFDRFSVFDMPLVATGEEDLYFTVSPSPYLDAHQLREILYDHLFARPGDADYGRLTPDDWQLMREFYAANAGKTLGVGRRQPRGDYWYPTHSPVLTPPFHQPPQDEDAS